ncbi:tripartite tricarboxylate transporter TctB family protein [Pseudomonas sp. AOB-7]|uniref:tripartite tricarboxylate transporter TctB family protein n=1 Tax=Pseudomonas sp. AOB-7 TaxID=2482750 RepID=UPI000EFAAE89|nr:tripartite tricarboxylate transporter TctB family protein [Pseudomonas sp. AOB-7]RMH85171.1 tripartite tricarboxylate transporter TctB family protein [Pseudomonas sp. AOB-7]
MNKTEKMLVGERSFCVLLLVFSLAILYLAYQIAGFSSANSPGAFPLGVGLVMLLAALKIGAETLAKAKPDCSGWLDAFGQFRRAHFPRRTLIFAVLAVAYLAAIQWISFYLSTFLFLVLSIVYLRRGRVVAAVLIAALLLLLIYLLFTLAFSVYLP